MSFEDQTPYRECRGSADQPFKPCYAPECGREQRPLWQGEVHEELRGLQDSLDEHVTKEDVATKLRELADSLEGENNG